MRISDWSSDVCSSDLNELIVGDQGDDTLFGRGGNDSYYYRAGDGNDRIYDSAGVDRLIFLEGIVPGAVTLSRDLTSIFATISVDGEDSQIRIDNVFDENGHLREGVIESMEFQDGTVWDLQFILSNLVVPITEGADTLYGTDRKSTSLKSSHSSATRMPSSA